MNGSEKQIAWANDILSKADEWAARVLEAVEDERFDPEREIIIDSVNQMMANLDGIRNDAAKIIEARNQFRDDFMYRFLGILLKQAGAPIPALDTHVNAVINNRR